MGIKPYSTVYAAVKASTLPNEEGLGGFEGELSEIKSVTTKESGESNIMNSLLEILGWPTWHDTKQQPNKKHEFYRNGETVIYNVQSIWLGNAVLYGNNNTQALLSLINK